MELMRTSERRVSATDAGSIVIMRHIRVRRRTGRDGRERKTAER
jgi:hypothetical protein